MMSRNGDGQQPDMTALYDGLRGDLSALKSDLAALREDTVAISKAGARSAVHKVGDKFDDMAHRAKSTVKGAADEIELRTEDLRTTIAQNPLMAIGAAVALGFVVGRAVVPRR